MKSKKPSVSYLVIIFLLCSFNFSQAEELKTFLKSCGYGTLAGAGVGLASLVFEKKPNESYGNIARGASLGLYFGIAYGFIMLNQQRPSVQENYTTNNKPLNWAIIPDEEGGMKALFSYDFSW